MTDILIGYGEVGQGIYEVFSERGDIRIHDPDKGKEAKDDDYVWMHIAIPYSRDFKDTVLSYIKRFEPSYIVIHSTVPVGTCDEIREGNHYAIIYSPIRGIHPDLARYIRLFPKWYACDWSRPASEYEIYCAHAGVQTRRAPSYEILELMKLLETMEYGYRICLWQEIERMVGKLHPNWRTATAGPYQEDISAIREWLFEKRKVYDGDRGLAPIMFGGFIGGHCVVPNWDLLKPLMTKELYKWLTTSNNLRKEV